MDFRCRRLQRVAYLEKGFDIERAGFEHEVFGAPMWVGDTYQTFKDSLKERGNQV
jgi:hypothetical protein